MPARLKRKLSVEDNTTARKQIKSVATNQKGTQKEKNRDAILVGRSQKANVQRSKQVAHLPGKDVSEHHDRCVKKSQNVAKGQVAKRTAESTKPATKRQREEDQVTPQHKRFKDALPLSPAQTPTKGACNLFDKLNLAARSARNVYDTPPLSPEPTLVIPTVSGEERPGSLQELPRLFTAFVNATSLYTAHNGTGSTLYLSTLLPMIMHTWKKRRVSELDIRRLLGVLGQEQTTFTLVDNGEGTVSLERVGSSYSYVSLDKKGLSASFERRLSDLWKEWCSKASGKSSNAEAFLDALPLARIVTSEVAVAPGKVSKGQARLQDIQRSRPQSNLEESANRTSHVAQQEKTAAAVSSRGSSLLDRIMAKQQAASSNSDCPTPEELDRRRALGRIEDVARVMDLLVGGRPRVSFAMQQMVQHLQNSLRNPISKEEAHRCLDLMAEEITPSFVSLIRSGGVCGVVVKKVGKPSAVDLHKKLHAAGA